MWLYCKSGFFSAVRHTEKKETVHVRARFEDDLERLCTAHGVKPDVKTKVDSLSFQHRHLADAEIYRICNEGTHAGRAKVRFRVRGREPLQWNPDTGEITPVSYKLKKRSSRVTFNTVPGDDTFIVFASYAGKRRLKVD